MSKERELISQLVETLVKDGKENLSVITAAREYLAMPDILTETIINRAQDLVGELEECNLTPTTR